MLSDDSYVSSRETTHVYGRHRTAGSARARNQPGRLSSFETPKCRRQAGRGGPSSPPPVKILLALQPVSCAI